MKKLTVFTPTYNRAKLLHNLYKSLLEQTSKDFIWIIVNDGGKDNTEQLVNNWILENKLNIIYVTQENQGKSIAHNKGIELCKTELFLCVDSDDILEKSAVERILNIYEKIQNKEGLWGIVGPKRSIKGKINKNFPKINQPLRFCDIYEKFNYKGEAYIVIITKYAKEFKFPKFENEKLMPESVLYDTLDIDKKVYIINDELYIYDYQENGYSYNKFKLVLNNINGFCYANKYRAGLKQFMFHKRVVFYARFLANKRLKKTEKILKDYKINPFVKILGFLFSIILTIKYGGNND
jgi:glycosyltransferase involved in cell wall biosynthesis